jgi:hypothetical protein
MSALPSPRPADTLPEAASEKRRGRPRITPPDDDLRCFPATSSRGRLEQLLAFTASIRLRRALGVPDREPVPPPFGYIIGDRSKGSLLAALGRLQDDDQLLDAARAICEKRMPVKVAIARIRRWRLGTIEDRAGTAQRKGLAMELANVIRKHERAVDLQPLDVCVVLGDLLHHFEQVVEALGADAEPEAAAECAS